MLVTTGALIIAGLIGGGLFARSQNKKTTIVEQKNTELERIEETDIFDVEEWINRYFGISTISLATMVASFWLPPLRILSVIGLTYLMIPIWQQAYKDLLKHKRFSTALLDSIALPAFALSGYLLVAIINNWLYYLGLKLIAQSKNQSINQLKNQLTQTIRSVWIRKDGCEIEIAYDALQLGDVVVIQAGEIVPVDGEIIEGIASIDERMMTGESQLAEKSIDEQVFAFTIVLSGKIFVSVKKTGKQTTAAQIEQALEQTNYHTAQIELKMKDMMDKAALPTFLLAACTLPSIGFYRALIVLDSPVVDSVMITGPMSILVHLSIASKQNILIKDGRVLEVLKQIDTIVFDKTGTLTQDQPHVSSVYSLAAYSEQDILLYAALIESKQTHPVARAICQAAEQYQFDKKEITDTQYDLGYGLKASIDGKAICVGSSRFMDLENIPIFDAARNTETQCHQQGFSVVYVAIDHELIGLIELQPTIRPEAKQVIQTLKARGLSVSIISGDHQNPTKALAEKLGIDQYFAEVLPEQKASLVEQLQQQGKSVCFIGDGVNDAIALKKAQVSISLHGASNIAMDTAQVLLMDENLLQLTRLFELADNLESNTRKGLILDVVPNVACIGGALFFHLGIYGALGIYGVGLLSGLANGMSPLLNKKLSNQQIEWKQP